MTTIPSVNTNIDRKTSGVEDLTEKGKKRLSDLSSANGENKNRNDPTGQKMRRNTLMDPYIPVHFTKNDKKFDANFKPVSNAGSVLE